MKKFVQHTVQLLLWFFLSSGFLFCQVRISTAELWNKPDATFFKKKRNALIQLLPPKSVAIFFSEDPDFYYLTGCKIQNAFLLVFKDPEKFQNTVQNEFLFIAEPNPQQRIAQEYILPVEWIEKFSGISPVFYHSVFAKSDFSAKKYDKTLYNPQYANSAIALEIKKRCETENTTNPVLKRYLTKLQDANFDTFIKFLKPELISALEYYPELRNSELLLLSLQVKNATEWEGLQKRITQYNADIYSLADFMNYIRQTKDENEIFLIKKATNIANVCITEMLKSVYPNTWEHEPASIADFYIQKYGALPAYPVEVASGENALLLKYTQNHRKIRENEWVRLNVGVNYAGWHGITIRTLPAGGKFSDNQKKIYQAVLKAHQAALEKCRPNENFNFPQETAIEILKNEFLNLGIIKKSEDLRKYILEDICQYIGTSYVETGLYTVFKPQQAITVSVSVFIPQKSDCDVKWWNTAIKITDTIIISDVGNQNLSGSVPKSVSELENVTRQKSMLNITLPSIE
jgi:Xaa-Pro aminopeptidase